MATKSSVLPIVSKVYCAPSEVILAVRRRPNVANGGGFVVADAGQRVLFRVDGCGVIGKKDELILKDGDGNALLLIRRKVMISSRDIFWMQAHELVDSGFVSVFC